jgi:hypothetical protein
MTSTHGRLQELSNLSRNVEGGWWLPPARRLTLDYEPEVGEFESLRA